MQPIFKAVTRWALRGAFFLVPLFFLPVTTNALDTNKQILLVILTLLALTSWLGSMVMSKRLSFRTGWLNALPALFLGATLASSVTSLAGYQSWVGQLNQEYVSFLSVAMYVVLFYVIANNAHESRDQRAAFVALLASTALCGIVAALSAFGWSPLPFAVAKSGGFNTVGSMLHMGIFLNAVAFMGLSAWLTNQSSGRGASSALIPSGKPEGIALRALVVVVVACAFVVNLAVDFWVLWALSILGVLLVAAFGFLQTSSFPEPRRFAVPMAMLLVAVLFLFVRTPLKSKIPVLVSPSYGTSMDIAKSALGSGTTRLLLGTGPGTFAFDYAMYKPQTVNNTVFWNTPFDRAKSHALTELATGGALGAILWLAAMLGVGALSLARLLSERDGESWKVTHVLFVGWTMLFVAHLLYSSTLTLSFALWGLSGLLAAQALRGTRETDFGKSPRMGFVFSFAFVAVAVGIVATLFVAGSRYGAEVAFAQAVKLDRAAAPVEEIIAKLGDAVSANGQSDVYYRNLSSALLTQARNQIALAKGAELSPEQRTNVTNLVSAAVNAAKRATDLEPNAVGNWAVRGAVYRDVMAFVTGAEDFAAATFKQAVALEPLNPSHYVNLARVYVSVSNRARQLKAAENAELAATATQSEIDSLALAEQALMRAIELKPDYAPAHYYLASVYERQDRLDDAVTRLVALRNAKPGDAWLGFQLAMMYIRTERLDLARAELERVTQAVPNYSNALWYLSAIYEKDGDIAKALAAVEKVAATNPDNAAVAARVKRLRSGETSDDIPAPVEEGEEGATDAGDGEVSGDGEGVIDEDTE